LRCDLISHPIERFNHESNRDAGAIGVVRTVSLASLAATLLGKRLKVSATPGAAIPIATLLEARYDSSC
jgi:hypothetical protein